MVVILLVMRGERPLPFWEHTRASDNGVLAIEAVGRNRFRANSHCEGFWLELELGKD